MPSGLINNKILNSPNTYTYLKQDTLTTRQTSGWKYLYYTQKWKVSGSIHYKVFISKAAQMNETFTDISYPIFYIIIKAYVQQ
jgi:hypothetical protein